MKLHVSNPFASITRSLFIAGLLFLSNCLQAQTEKGTISVGLHNFSPNGINIDGVPVNLFGNGSMLGLSWGKSSFYKDGKLIDDPQAQYTLGLNFNAHYFPINKLSIGAVGSFFSGFSVYPDDATEEGRYAARILLAGPEVRYYVGAGKSKVWIKASGALGDLNVWWDGNKKEPTHLSKLAAGAGVSWFLSPVISLDLGMEYNVFMMKLPTEVTAINTNLALDVGVSLFIGSRKN